MAEFKIREPQEGKFTVFNRNTKDNWNYNYTSLETAIKKLNQDSVLFVHVKGSYTSKLITEWYPEMNYIAGYYSLKNFGLKPFETKTEAIIFLEKEIRRFKEQLPFLNTESYVFIEVKHSSLSSNKGKSFDKDAFTALISKHHPCGETDWNSRQDGE